jgi:hypothetical protein
MPAGWFRQGNPAVVQAEKINKALQFIKIKPLASKLQQDCQDAVYRFGGCTFRQGRSVVRGDGETDGHDIQAAARGAVWLGGYR